jgi:hypothetical protein
MKKFLLKTLDITLTVIMILSALYAVFNMIMAFLPVEIQTQVFGWLHMSSEYIATFSISSVINAVILVLSKMLQANMKVALSAKLAKAEHVISNGIASNDKILERTNEIINSLNVLQDLNNAILSVQKVTTERNIKASDKLVLKGEKEAYKNALLDIEKAKEKLKDIDNISKVFKKEKVVEVEKIVEKVVDPLEGRV